MFDDLHEDMVKKAAPIIKSYEQKDGDPAMNSTTCVVATATRKRKLDADELELLDEFDVAAANADHSVLSSKRTGKVEQK